VGLASAGDGRSDADINPANGPIPFVSQRPWVKLVVGCGILRTWIGPDGVHWAPAVTTVQNVPAGLATIGPFCKASESKRTIRVARVVVRELDGLTNLVGDEVRGRAKAFVRANNLAEWLKQVSASRPPDLKLDEWARGCALATLGQGADPRLRTALLTMLLDDVASLEAAGLPVETRLKALDDGALVANTWENHADALLFSARYRRLGERLFEAGGTGGASGTPGAGGASGTPDGRASGVPGVLKAATGTPRPYSLLRAAQIRSPVASRHGVPAGVSSLARLELLAAVYDGRWDELDRVCRKVKFWRSFSPGAEGRDNLTDWAQAVAAERLGQRSRSRSAAMLPAWRHPLDEQTAADVFNLMAEFNAALESKAYQDAAGTIASATGKLLDGDSAGLLADAHDRDLFLSLATAVRLSMRDHPPLAEAMNEHFGPIARQRVQRAMSEGDRGVLEAATIQFYGTEAASMAHVWLGSAALALGEFAQALAHFEHARPHAAVGERAAIAARARLAAAYLGREIGPPATTNVTLGPTELSAGEFEALVGEVRGRVDGRGRETHAQQAETRAQQGARLGRAVLEPASYRLEKRGEFDAGTVDRPPGATTDDARAVIDWFARQTAGVLAEERIIFTSRYATTAFDRRSGSEKWRNGPSTPVGRGGGSTSVVAAAHPLIVGNRIFVRRGGTPTLMSIDRENGKTVWEARLERQEAVVSDPLWAGGQLLAFVVRQDERQTVTTLSLAVFDPAVGEVRRRRPLARLRGSWSSQPVCQVTVEDETIYAALGGAVLCCNSAGQIGWLRRSERVPAEVDSWSQLQAHDPPVVIGERLVVTQPGVRVIECLETATGRRHWHRVFPDLVSMVGVAEEFIVVHTRDEVVGLKLGTGEMAWRYRIDGSCTPAGCSKEGKVLLSRTEGRRLTLVWLDAKAGREIGRFAPEGQDAGGMILGPIVAEADGRGWALMSRDEKSARRDLCELISVGPVSAGSKTIEQSVWSGGVRPN